MNPYARFLGKEDPLRVAATTPTRIRSLIRGLSPRQLGKPPEPGKWSIREIILHLAEAEMVLCCRDRWIVFEDNSKLVPFDQEKWAKAWMREKEPVAEAFERFRLLRMSHMRLFRSASKAEFERTGLHEERGVISLRDQLEMLAGHDLNHLGQIERIAAGFKI